MAMRQLPGVNVIRETSPEYLADVVTNPWDNVYWFARMLIASDKYGGVGTDTTIMIQMAAAIRTTLTKLASEEEETVLEVTKDAIGNILLNRWGRTKKRVAVARLLEDLEERLLTLRDLEVLALTCEKIMVPINKALRDIPNDDRVFAESIVGALLKTKGEAGLATVINLWDDVGAYGCMTAERAEIVQTFGVLRNYLDGLDLSRDEKDIILTAFCQEFERRVGQKRKGRAGRGVENATSFILDHFGIGSTSHGPEHFTTAMEIDRWVRAKDGWYIGISCKRTLRERWKQAYTTDMDLLNRHKIKALWHVLTFDRDLSDDKLTEMGSHRALFYLRDDSPRYQSAAAHVGMKTYARPMSLFISDLRSEVIQ